MAKWKQTQPPNQLKDVGRRMTSRGPVDGAAAKREVSAARGVRSHRPVVLVITSPRRLHLAAVQARGLIQRHAHEPTSTQRRGPAKFLPGPGGGCRKLPGNHQGSQQLPGFPLNLIFWYRRFPLKLIRLFKGGKLMKPCLRGEIGQARNSGMRVC